MCFLLSAGSLSIYTVNPIILLLFTLSPPASVLQQKTPGLAVFLDAVICRDLEAVGLQIGPGGVTICLVFLSGMAQSHHFTISLKKLINLKCFLLFCWTLRCHFPQLDLHMQDVCIYTRHPLSVMCNSRLWNLPPVFWLMTQSVTQSEY